MLRNLLPITIAAVLLANAAPATAEYTLPANSIFATAAASPEPTPVEVSSPLPPAAQIVAPIEIWRINTFPIGGGIYGACIDFQNTSTVTMTAIRFDFIYTNAFNEVIANFHGDRQGMFSPHVSISGPGDANQYYTARYYRAEYGTSPSNGIVDNCWTYYIRGDINNVHVRAVRIVYADGTSWSL